MDHRLLAWARAVKCRRRNRLPVLWLFTDATRLADPSSILHSLPKHLCGVVLRHGDAAFARRLAAKCRALRIPLVLAPGLKLPAHRRAGRHLRGGKPDRARQPPGLRTASAHNIAELRRAAQGVAGAGANIIFLSPAFATASHPGAPALGPLRWNRLARQVAHPVIHALGGIDGRTITTLGSRPAGVGGISIFLD